MRPKRATAYWWAAARPVRWPGSPGAFMCLCMPHRAPSGTGSRRTFPEQAQHADQHLAAFDKRRAAVIRKFYQQEWCARGLYHMLLNSCIGIEAMIAAVQGAAGLAGCAKETAAG